MSRRQMRRAGGGGGRRARLLAAGLFGSLCLIAQPCFAAHWQVIGPVKGGSPGLVYIDLDSVREEDGYRVALFLTIYTSPVPNAHHIRLDRITQETAFDCTRREASLRSTVGYLEGKEVGLSTARSDWKEQFNAVPKDTFSQRVLDMACNSPLAPQPEPTPSAAEAPGSVQLPGAPGAERSAPANQ
jgi:hypothetical protein